MITASPITIRRFGPSGSSIKRKVALEKRREVIPKMSSINFFGVMDMR